MIFWWSVISTVIGVILLSFDVWFVATERERNKRKNSQVKIWQQDANGISQGMKRIVSDMHAGNYSTIQDMASAVWTLETSAFSLYQSLYEERTLTDEEYKERQKKIEAKLDQDFQPPQPLATPVSIEAVTPKKSAK